MARKLRVEYPGAMYPALIRGEQHEAIFRDDADCWRASASGWFLSITGKERALTAEARAEQIIAEELQRRRWAPADLKTRRGRSREGRVGGTLAGRDHTTLTAG